MADLTETTPLPVAPLPPVTTPADRVMAALDNLNKSVGADIHDRLHAQTTLLNAMVAALFQPGGTNVQS